MRLEGKSEQAALAAYLLKKAGDSGLLADGAVVSAYATDKSASVTVMWPDDEEEDDGGWVRC